MSASENIRLINMAAVLATADMTIQRNSQILVNVEEALEDLLVVSYSTESKKFQGVLLDSNKGNLPFGVYSLNPAFLKTTENKTSHDDKLHSASQRFTYQEPQYANEDYKNKKQTTKSKPQPRQKMTVRLRPRKVLCSNCQGICNENNENVDVSKKRKLESDDDTARVDSESSRLDKKYLNMKSMLIPKLSRLQPSEISSATKSTKMYPKSSEKVKSMKSETCDKSDKTQEVAFVSVSDSNENTCDNKNDEAPFSNLFSSARTLKICFGEGEGTVVKIPPLNGDFNEDSGVSCDMAKPPKPDSKAVKKALKKAKKQAKKSAIKTDPLNAPSPKHIGALSPRNNLSQSPPSDPLEKKHRHKVKHKKKNRITRQLDENSTKSDGDYFSNIKDSCLKQKVSINLRRLSSNSYECQEEESDDCESEIVPDFPPNSESIGGRLLRVSAGDIVWGKIVGFPWWPGKVLSVTSMSKAHVAWFASTTSSLIPCDSLCPFLEDYKLRFNKKKRGAYKEAVKQATIEAKHNESRDPLASPNHALTTVSPRPIDVFS